MQATSFGLGRIFFLYVYDPVTQKTLNRFGQASELIAKYHEEAGVTPLMREIQDVENAPSWACYIQHEQGSLVSTNTVVVAGNQQQALTKYFEVCLHQVLNERVISAGGKSFFLCEGERGLLWLLNDEQLSDLFRKHHSLMPESFFTRATLLDWMSYGTITKSEYMSLLADFAAAEPNLINSAQRVQIGLQIIQRDLESPTQQTI